MGSRSSHRFCAGNLVPAGLQHLGELAVFVPEAPVGVLDDELLALLGDGGHGTPPLFRGPVACAEVENEFLRFGSLSDLAYWWSQ